MAGKRLTKTQIVQELSTLTELDKKLVQKVLDVLADLTAKQLHGPGAPGEFIVPGLVKLRLVEKKATEQRQGINPHTREPMVIPAKPATKAIRAGVLKVLKDQIQ